MLVLAGIAAGYYWTGEIRVQSVAFSGQYYTDEAALRNNVQIPMGQRPDSINFTALIQRIEKLPYVRQAGASVDHRGQLVISVEERKPLAMILGNSGSCYVDEDGVRMPVVKGKSADVPLVYGFSAKPIGDTLTSDAFGHLRDFLVEARNHKVAWPTISEIQYQPKKGIVAISGEDNLKLVFGTGDYQRKLKYWEAFYGDVLRREAPQNLARVDLRFDGQIVTSDR